METKLINLRTYTKRLRLFFLLSLQNNKFPLQLQVLIQTFTNQIKNFNLTDSRIKTNKR